MRLEYNFDMPSCLTILQNIIATGAVQSSLAQDNFCVPACSNQKYPALPSSYKWRSSGNRCSSDDDLDLKVQSLKQHSFPTLNALYSCSLPCIRRYSAIVITSDVVIQGVIILKWLHQRARPCWTSVQMFKS